jgi:hypothetical protein
MQEVFQELLSVHNAAVIAKTHTDFDPTKPWDSVWRRVLEMKDWWNDEFERPAGLINTKVLNIGNVLGGDVQISSNHQRTSAPQQPHQPAKGTGKVAKTKKKTTNNNNRKGGDKGANKGGNKGGNSNPSTAAASGLWCKICKSDQHDHVQCPQFDPNFSKGRGKKGGGKNKK